jgi:uncharacterized protein YaeQ
LTALQHQQLVVGIETKLTRAANLVVWQIEAAQSQALAKLAERSMQLQVHRCWTAVWMSTALGSDHA